MHLTTLEKIRSVLLQMPELIQKLEDKNPEAIDLSIEWLKKIEEMLKSNNLSQTSTISSLRGAIVASKEGANIFGIAFVGKITPPKLRFVVCNFALGQASNVALELIKPYENTFAEAQKLADRIIGVAKYKNMISDNLLSMDHQNMLTSLFSLLKNDADIGQATMQLSNMVGFWDALVLLDRSLSTQQ